jgi:hypothetical protein
MPKFDVSEHDGETYVRYTCPGCKHEHSVPAKRWNWNGDVNKPTLSPSVRHYITFPEGTKRAGQQHTTCHYHIIAGRIEFCGDCEHELKGQKVELPNCQGTTPT